MGLLTVFAVEEKIKGMCKKKKKSVGCKNAEKPAKARADFKLSTSSLIKTWL